MESFPFTPLRCMPDGTFPGSRPCPLRRRPIGHASSSGELVFSPSASQPPLLHLGPVVIGTPHGTGGQNGGSKAADARTRSRPPSRDAGDVRCRLRVDILASAAQPFIDGRAPPSLWTSRWRAGLGGAGFHIRARLVDAEASGDAAAGSSLRQAGPEQQFPCGCRDRSNKPPQGRRPFHTLGGGCKAARYDLAPDRVSRNARPFSWL